jgi:transcriptional regulator with XRE-family HTH domain
MTPDEYRQLIESLGLTVQGSAEVLGIGERSAYRYANGRTAVPPSVAKLLRMLVAQKETAQ